MLLEIESSNLQLNGLCLRLWLLVFLPLPFLGLYLLKMHLKLGVVPPLFFPLFAAGAGTPEANMVEGVTGGKLRARPKKRMPLF